MKKLFFLAAFFLTISSYSQKNEKPIAEYNFTDVKVTMLTFNVSASEDLKSINWNDIKEIFKNNKNPKQEVELAFKFDLPESKNKISGEFKIHGENRNIDDIIVRAKKGVKGLIKIMNKNKK
jgi:hypothetical protein